MDILNLGEKILALLEMVFGFWNNQISLVFAMLGQSPVSFKGGGPWALIEAVNPIFVAVGSSLVVLFFVIGFCSESVDVREEMRFEVILHILIRLGLAEWFVVNNVVIAKAVFQTVGNLVNTLSAGAGSTLVIDSTQADIIRNLGPCDICKVDLTGLWEEKLEMVAVLSEALCGESYETVTPAYYQSSLKDKAARDEIAYDMLDLIRDSRKFDFGYLYNFNITYCGYASFMENLMNPRNPRNDFVSYYEKREKEIDSYFTDVFEFYEDYILEFGD